MADVGRLHAMALRPPNYTILPPDRGPLMKYIALAIVLLLLAGLALLPRTPRVSPEDARALVSEGALLLDVRSPQEFSGGHIEGAINIPVHQLAERIDEIPNAPIVLYCRSGQRSGRAAALLTGAGRDSVHDLGPMSRW